MFIRSRLLLCLLKHSRQDALVSLKARLGIGHGHVQNDCHGGELDAAAAGLQNVVEFLIRLPACRAANEPQDILSALP